MPDNTIFEYCDYITKIPIYRKKASSNFYLLFMILMNVIRAVSSEGLGRFKYQAKLLDLFENDPDVRSYWNGECKEIPVFYKEWIKMDLGPLRRWLPENAYLKSQEPEVMTALAAEPQRPL